MIKDIWLVIIAFYVGSGLLCQVFLIRSSKVSTFPRSFESPCAGLSIWFQLLERQIVIAFFLQILETFSCVLCVMSSHVACYCHAVLKWQIVMTNSINEVIFLRRTLAKKVVWSLCGCTDEYVCGRRFLSVWFSLKCGVVAQSMSLLDK